MTSFNMIDWRVSENLFSLQPPLSTSKSTPRYAIYLPFSENNGTRDIWHCVCEHLFTIKWFPFVFIKHIDQMGQLGLHDFLRRFRAGTELTETLHDQLAGRFPIPAIDETWKHEAFLSIEFYLNCIFTFKFWFLPGLRNSRDANFVVTDCPHRNIPYRQGR